MSLSDKMSIRCPECNGEIKVDVYTSITATLNPELKQQILEGEFHKIICPACGATSHLQYNFLFHDPKYRYMISVGQDYTAAMSKMPAPDEYRFRLVKNYIELNEKIRIFDMGLDDAVVEGVKLLIASKIGSIELRFVEWKDNKIVFANLNDDGNAIAVNSAVYDLALTYINNSNVPQHCFAVVDDKFARKVMGVSEAKMAL